MSADVTFPVFSPHLIKYNCNSLYISSNWNGLNISSNWNSLNIFSTAIFFVLLLLYYTQSTLKPFVYHSNASPFFPDAHVLTWDDPLLGSRLWNPSKSGTIRTTSLWVTCSSCVTVQQKPFAKTVGQRCSQPNLILSKQKSLKWHVVCLWQPMKLGEHLNSMLLNMCDDTTLSRMSVRTVLDACSTHIRSSSCEPSFSYIRKLVRLVLGSLSQVHHTHTQAYTQMYTQTYTHAHRYTLIPYKGKSMVGQLDWPVHDPVLFSIIDMTWTKLIKAISSRNISACLLSLSCFKSLPDDNAWFCNHTCSMADIYSNLNEKSAQLRVTSQHRIIYVCLPWRLFTHLPFPVLPTFYTTVPFFSLSLSWMVWCHRVRGNLYQSGVRRFGTGFEEKASPQVPQAVPPSASCLGGFPGGRRTTPVSLHRKPDVPLQPVRGPIAKKTPYQLLYPKWFTHPCLSNNGHQTAWTWTNANVITFLAEGTHIIALYTFWLSINWSPYPSAKEVIQYTVPIRGLDTFSPNGKNNNKIIYIYIYKQKGKF